MLKNIQNTINCNLSLTQALEHLSRAEIKCLLVVDNNNSIIGTLTDGDIRRTLIVSKHLNKKVKEICNKKFFHLKKPLSKSKLNEIFLKKKIPLIPLIKKKKYKKFIISIKF